MVTPEGIQEATIIVAKGYQPKRVLVETGQLVRLHFDRQNLSECYDQLLIPAFAVAIDLTPDQTTTVEFTPEQPGEYEFMCGMKMNRGVIEVCNVRSPSCCSDRTLPPTPDSPSAISDRSNPNQSL